MSLDLRHIVCDCGYGCYDGFGCMAREDAKPRTNGVRVVHRDARGRAMPERFGRRWVPDGHVEPTRVRTCRGSRR